MALATGRVFGRPQQEIVGLVRCACWVFAGAVGLKLQRYIKYSVLDTFGRATHLCKATPTTVSQQHSRALHSTEISSHYLAKVVMVMGSRKLGFVSARVTESWNMGGQCGVRRPPENRSDLVEEIPALGTPSEWNYIKEDASDDMKIMACSLSIHVSLTTIIVQYPPLSMRLC